MTENPVISQGTQVLRGVARLGGLLEQSADSALYEAVLDGSREPVSAPATVEVRPAGTPEAALQLNRWSSSLPLTHPNLLKLHDAGESALAGHPVIYLVTERADESLAGVLTERPLSEPEAREMLEPILSALLYLHQAGFAHTSLTPANVRAAGDTLKLSSSTLQRISEGADPAADMRSLGVLLVQALTRTGPEMDEDSGPYIFREASEPFSGIVRHCLEPDRSKRWTAEQTLAYLSPKPASPPLRQRQPVEPATLAPPLAPNRKWIYGAAAALLLLAAAIGLTRKADTRTPVLPLAQQAPSPAVPTSPVPTAAVPTPADLAPKAAVSPLRHPRGEGWVVVVASYGARGPAEKRARELTRRWPKFHVEVFQPPSQKTRNLVIIGKNLSQEKADALRKRAHQAGLPRDTYIKRFE